MRPSELYFILDAERRPVAADRATWWDWFRHETNRRVGDDMVGPWRVSTVFVGTGNVELCLFETQICRDGEPLLTLKWATWDEAAERHKGLIELLRRVLASGEPWPPPL
jgi:hypothetical protein